MLDRNESGPPVSAALAPGESDDIRGYRKLWAAVILEQFKVAFSGRRSSGQSLHPSDQSTVDRWFRSEDFHIACEFAGVDREKVLSAYQAIKANPELWDLSMANKPGAML